MALLLLRLKILKVSECDPIAFLFKKKLILILLQIETFVCVCVWICVLFLVNHYVRVFWRLDCVEIFELCVILEFWSTLMKA